MQHISMQPSAVTTILIISNPCDHANCLQTILYERHYQVFLASDGTSGFTLACARQPDVIVIDATLTDGSYELCQRIQQEQCISNIPIIFYDGHGDAANVKHAFQSGGADYIKMPCQAEEILARIEHQINQYQSRRTLRQHIALEQLLTTQAALEIEQARFEWVVEHAPQGFLLVNSQDEILYANRQARLYLLLDPVSENDQNKPELSFLEHARQYYHTHPSEIWSRWPEPIGYQPGEATRQDQDHRVRYLVRPETISAPALWLQVELLDPPDSAETGRLIRLSDVTEQMTTQRQMWTFHALISHKLNTPISCLINSLYVLSNEHESIPPNLHELATIAFDSAQQLHQQLSRIRYFLSASNLAYTGDECLLSRLPQMVKTICTELDVTSFELSGLEHLQRGCLVISHQAMAFLLRQVLENAKKFHPTHTPTIEVAFDRPTPKELRIMVRDDGKTLTPEQLARVWLPYYQAEKGFSGQVPGMGLGLAIVSSLLWNVGGHYRIANRESSTGLVVELIVPLVLNREQCMVQEALP
jgi:DNA-binding response OmpR family regulator